MENSNRHKYRVWDKKQKKMSKSFGFGDLYGYEGETNAVLLYSPTDDKGQYGFVICPHGGKGVNKNLIFLLFTGRLDRNGVEIYEGDIIKKYFEGVGTDGKNYFQLTIEWNDATGGFEMYDPEKTHGWESEDMEIIGNKYEMRKSKL